MTKTDAPVVLETKGLIKKYKVGSEIITALAGVDIKIYKGEFVAVLGTSGCGKSTLLNMISGLERPTKGDIIIGSTRINKVSERNMARFRSREMGFIFQAYNLIPSLTAMENVTLPLMLQGVSKKKREKKAKAMLIELGLGKRLHNKPSQLSGGQQQRVAIARPRNPQLRIRDVEEFMSKVGLISPRRVNLLKSAYEHNYSRVEVIEDSAILLGLKTIYLR